MIGFPPLLVKIDFKTGLQMLSTGTCHEIDTGEHPYLSGSVMIMKRLVTFISALAIRLTDSLYFLDGLRRIH